MNATPPATSTTYRMHSRMVLGFMPGAYAAKPRAEGFGQVWVSVAGRSPGNWEVRNLTGFITPSGRRSKSAHGYACEHAWQQTRRVRLFARMFSQVESSRPQAPHSGFTDWETSDSSGSFLPERETFASGRLSFPSSRCPVASRAARAVQPEHRSSGVISRHVRGSSKLASQHLLAFSSAARRVAFSALRRSSSFSIAEPLVFGLVARAAQPRNV